MPSTTASANSRMMISIARIASSLPGIGKSIMSGSLSVSISATVGTPSFLASLTAMCSRRVSMTNISPGIRSIRRIPSRFVLILVISRCSAAFIFLE